MTRPESNLRVSLIIITIALITSSALAEHYTMLIGSKSNPKAHLFAYDQKFRESTYFQNSPMDVGAAIEFTDATRLATELGIKANGGDSSSEEEIGCGCYGFGCNGPFTDIAIKADFIGIGRIDYLVLDPDNDKKNKKKEQTRISHMYIGNFSLDEHFRVVRNHMNENWFMGCA
jgi:hypothetical protein